MQHSDDVQTALQKAARIIHKLERRVAELEAPRLDPIAIVGAGCRLPGGIADLGSLWRVLASDSDVIGAAPADRTGLGAGSAVRDAGWLDAVDRFDAGFFGIAPREAAWTDPQQRLLLECAWEAIERAGITRARLREAPTGVYVGLGSHDYAHLLLRRDASELEPYLATGTSSSFAAGRIAYVLGLQGPALTVDTSCSSSLVALHLACRALRADECELALVGGVQLMLSELPFVVLSRLGALAPDGRCKTFSERADGYGRSEGCVVLAVERLSTARRRGDPILGLVRGSAINHDGDKSGITTPNGNAQRAVIRKALADARLEALDVDYVEAHGTGTPLGDPIELEALADVYAEGRAEPLRIGSSKSSLGHLEAAAGLAGVLKVLAAFQNEALPANLHATPPSRRVDWAKPMKVLTELESWCRSARTRRAGVSSFGMSGTNAHVVLEESPSLAPETAGCQPRPAELVVLSAKSPAALVALKTRLREQLASQPELELGDVAYSLATARTPFAERWVLCAATRDELERALAETSAPVAATAEARGVAAPAHPLVHGTAPQLPPQLTWLLPGAGAARAGMGQALYREWPVFRAALDAAFEALDPLLERPLRSLLWAEPAQAAAHADLERPAHAEPALFALGWALAALWRSWGVEPDRIVCDGSGEITAACITGVLSLDDGARCVTRHAAARQAASAGTAPPASWVQALQRASWRRPALPWISTRAGSAAPERIATPGYWLEQVALPVRLEAAAWAVAAGEGVCLELAPVECLGPALEAHWPARLLYRLPAQEPGVPEFHATLNALGHWIARGGAVNAAGLFPEARRRLELPTYPWQRQRHWVDAARPPSIEPAGERPSTAAASVTALAADRGARAAPSRASAEGPSSERSAAESTPGALRGIVHAEVARVLGLAPSALPASMPLRELGLDSVMALELESALCRRFDISLPASPPLDALGARALADAVLAALPRTGAGEVGAGEVARGECLARLARPRARLFCFPGAGGSVAMFRPFASLSAAGLEVHAVAHRRASGRDGADAGIGERYLAEAAAYIRAFSSAPAILLGHSLGALLAWRVAARLIASGHPGPALFVPSAMGPRGLAAGASLAEILAPVLGRGADPSVELGSVSRDFAADLALYAALPELPPAPLECPIAAFYGRDDALVSMEAMQRWQPLTRSGFSVAILPGDHFYLHQAEPLRRFLAILRQKVEGSLLASEADAARPN